MTVANAAEAGTEYCAAESAATPASLAVVAPDEDAALLVEAGAALALCAALLLESLQAARAAENAHSAITLTNPFPILIPLSHE